MKSHGGLRFDRSRVAYGYAKKGTFCNRSVLRASNLSKSLLSNKLGWLPNSHGQSKHLKNSNEGKVSVSANSYGYINIEYVRF